MMGAREKAAAGAFAALMGGGPTEALDREYSGKILAAADAVMFSDEAVVRAAWVVAHYEGKTWLDMPNKAHADLVRAVFAALKGDDA